MNSPTYYMRHSLVALLLMLCNTAWAQTRLDYFMIEAAKCRMRNNMSACLQMYRHALEIDPTCPEALFQLGLAHIYLREDSLGTEYLERAAEQDSSDAYYIEALASLYLRQEAIAEATSLLERLAKLQPKRTDVIYQLINIYARTEDYERAIAMCNRLELQEGKSGSLSHEKFSLYMQMGDSTSAFGEMQSLCDEFPADMNYRVGMAYAYQHAGNFPRALEIYQEVQRIDPDNPSLRSALLDYYRQVGPDSLYQTMRDAIIYSPKTNTAERLSLLQEMAIRAATSSDSLVHAHMVQTFENVLRIDSLDVDLYSLYAMYSEEIKAPRIDVHNILVRLVAVAPDNDNALQWLLRYYGDESDYISLEDICRKGANYHPENLLYHYFLAVSLTLQSKTDDALEALQRGLQKRSPDSRAEMVATMFTYVGDMLYEKGQRQEAFAQYDSALVYNPHDAACLNNYAYFLSLRNEDLARAEEMSFRAIKEEPTNTTYLDTYAWIKFMQGDYAAAAECMNLVVPQDSIEQFLATDTTQSAVVIEHAGDIAWMCGNKERAILLWRHASKMKDQDGVSNVLTKKARKKKYYKAKER